MPRKSRKNLAGNFFHVMVQGINKEDIFVTNKNKNVYKNIIIKYYKEINTSELNILSYCFMNNHTHFLFYCESLPKLSSFMQKINSSYSRYYNKTSSRVGYVFRDRFKIQEITDINHLYNCLKYIHNNPVKACICTNMCDYYYSSYNEFFGSKKIINNNSIKLLFGSTSNFLESFKIIHETYNDENFLDLKELSLSDFTNSYMEETQLSIDEIKQNNCFLRNYVKKARLETSATLAEISVFLGVSVSRVGYQSRK